MAKQQKTKVVTPQGLTSFVGINFSPCGRDFVKARKQVENGFL
jgi:hypothetical protein